MFQKLFVRKKFIAFAPFPIQKATGAVNVDYLGTNQET
jgi:hypothetical protein